ncbi:MAG: Spy/CpxP family protein refolding chaperone [Acidobacteria bacterium]|nr:Spy/CpxP family protein refolding chaperone [Acidobacteriota bacterium]
MKKVILAITATTILGLGAVLIFGQKMGGERFGFGPKGFGGPHFERLFEKLNLTEEQKTQVKQIIEDSKTRVKPLMESLRANHEQMEKLGKDGVYNEEQVTQLAAAQADTMKQLIIEKEKTKAQIFAVLTPEQRAQAEQMKEQFKERFKERFKRGFGRGQGFGPGPGFGPGEE